MRLRVLVVVGGLVGLWLGWPRADVELEPAAVPAESAQPTRVSAPTPPEAPAPEGEPVAVETRPWAGLRMSPGISARSLWTLSSAGSFSPRLGMRAGGVSVGPDGLVVEGTLYRWEVAREDVYSVHVAPVADGSEVFVVQLHEPLGTVVFADLVVTPALQEVAAAWER